MTRGFTRAGLARGWLAKSIGLVALILCSAGRLGAATLTLPATGANPGSAFTVAVGIDNASGVLGTDLVVTYAAGTLQATSVTKTAITSPHTLTVNLGTPGVIRISLFGTTPLSGGGPYLTLGFDATGAEGSASPLQFQSASLNEGMIAADTVNGSVCVRTPASEVTGLAVGHAGAGLLDAAITWSPAALADTYNVYRATRADLGDLACFDPDLGGTSTTDAALSPVGGMSVYLVTALNCRGEATAGAGTSGIPRAIPAPCP